MASNFGFKLLPRSVSSADDDRVSISQDPSTEKKEKKEKKRKKETRIVELGATPQREKEKKEKKSKSRSTSSPSLRSSSSRSRKLNILRADPPLTLDEQEKFVQDLLAAELERRQCGDDVREAERQRRDAELLHALIQEEERIARVEKSAEKMKEMSDKLQMLAKSYEGHRVAIATALAPVKEKYDETRLAAFALFICLRLSTRTERLQLVKRNAEATRVTLENMLALTNLPAQLEPVAKQGPGGDVSGFLLKLEEARSAASLFESARHWRAGDAALEKLKPIIVQMIAALDVPYQRLLAKCASAAELRKFPEDASVRPQLMSSKRTEQLRRLISHLSAPYSTVGYLPEFIDSRSRFIATTLKKLSGGAAPVLGDGLVYTKGSHRIIVLIRVVLQLCMHEEWLAGSVLPHTAYDLAVPPVMETATDLLSGEGEMLTKERGTDTLLPAMDACQTLTGLLPKFTTLLTPIGKGKALRDITELHARLTAACKRVVTDIETVVRRGFRTAEIPADGTVHEHTVNTLLLLRRCVDYQTLLGKLLQSEYHTSRGPVKEFYSTILGELRTQLQERSKKAARAELRPLLGDADLADLESLQSSARSVYRNSWNETLEFLWEPKGWQNNKSGKTVIKKRFKGFNESLESLFAAQRHYAVPDAGLRTQLRADIKAVLMPLYENWIQNKNKGKYVKFSAQTLSAVIDRFFEDQPVAVKKANIASRISAVGKGKFV